MSDVRNPQQFFHGSDHEFEPGDEVLPQSRTGNVRFKQAIPERADSVYFTDRRRNAKYWGKNVYEVAPTGPVIPDEYAEDRGDYRSTGARVVSTPKSRAKANGAMLL